MREKLSALKAQLLGSYEVRKNKKQKDAFAAWVKDYAQALGYTAQEEACGKWLKSRNIVIGDLDKARTLITAHYDTCAWLPFGNWFTPDCWPLIILTQGVVPVAVFIALCIWLGVTGGTIAFEILLLLVLFGPANPHTANDNTSGVALVLLAMDAFVGREDVAFVLFDNEEIGLIGSSAFVKAHPALSRRVLALNFDCISDGDTLLFAGSKAAMRSPKAKKLADALDRTAPLYGKEGKSGEAPRVFYPSDQLVFRRGAAFAALKGKRILYMDRIHSSHDTVFEDDNLLCLVDVLKACI